MITNKNAEAFVITTSESKFLLDILLSQSESVNFQDLNLNESLLGVENSEVINFVNKVLIEFAFKRFNILKYYFIIV